MKTYRIARQLLLGLAVLVTAGWFAARFAGPILGVSHEGFYELAGICLLFAIAIGVDQLAGREKGL